MLSLRKILFFGGIALIIGIAFHIIQNISSQNLIEMRQGGCLNLARSINNATEEMKCNCSYANYGTLGSSIKNTCLCDCEINLTYCSENPEKCVFANSSLKNPYVSIYILCEDINCVSYRIK